ncbi:hypothetical protein EVAR_62993_1 [Eumeta japonica]|uniref:Uncharacterized protein n=1 Tax=Eumeta variegata TaxID=151549 RepID=A0A4C2AB29_EUMVA|nr:hypothetical protein EVAR_62993_1 [Eumeta japonica]
MGPPDGERPNPTIKITCWKRESTALEKIDTPSLNSIPDDISTTNEIDSAIGALTRYVRTVVGRCEREVPTSSDSRKFPPDILGLIRAKNAAISRVSAYPTPEYRFRVRALQREVEARKVTKALKTEGYIPIPPLKRPDNSVALDDAEIAECLADSVEVQCSHAFPPHDIAHFNLTKEEVLLKTSLEPKDYLPPVSNSEVQTLAKTLNTRKAPGLNDISNKAIKCFSLPLLGLLVATFSACLKIAISFLPGRRRRAGVSQGSSLSPLLYSSYTNEIPRPSSGVQLSLVADGIALYYRNRYRKSTFLYLQRAIDELGSNPNALLRAAVDYEPPHSSHFIRGLRMYSMIHLTLLQRQLKVSMKLTICITD